MLGQLNAEKFEPREIVCPENIVCCNVIIGAKLNGYIVELRLKCAKDFIPKNECAPKVSIQVRRILSMMNPVM